MKRATALRYCTEINRRVSSVSGLLSTPLCDYEAARISRIWCFGSTAKGSFTPRDLDLLIEMKDAGRHLTWRQSRVDKRYLHSYGIKSAPSSREYALKWLTKGMRMVSRHVDDDPNGPRILVYPKCEMLA